MSAGESATWDALAREAGARRGEAEQRVERQLLRFSLAGDAYAMSVEGVREIVRMRKVTPIPRVPEAIPGVISLRGDILEVIDLRRRLGLPPAEPTRSSRIVVVVAGEGRTAGLLVDEVTEVLRVAEAELRPSGASDAAAVESLCVRGDRFISLLDLDRILEFDADH
jgi:chemotaxis signal transduction protein